MEFVSEIKIRGSNPYVLVTNEQLVKLKPGWKKPLPVLVKVNGKPTNSWRINMMPAGDGSFYLYLHETIRKASNTKVGDCVTIDLSFDSNYRNGPMHPMPQWFHEALKTNQIAKNNWDMLSPSRKKEILRYFSLLQSPEAIARNLKRVMHVLSGEPGRFMARSWEKGK